MAVLMDGIRGDTAFLRECDVMDYSLLLGINSASGRVVVGIIDYANTYSTRKVMEKHIKMLVERDVTVQPPGLYRARMLRAVRNYFMAVPTRMAGPSIALKLREDTPLESAGTFWEPEDSAIDSDANDYGWRLPSARVREVAERVLAAQASSPSMPGV